MRTPPKRGLRACGEGRSRTANQGVARQLDLSSSIHSERQRPEATSVPGRLLCLALPPAGGGATHNTGPLR